MSACRSLKVVCQVPLLVRFLVREAGASIPPNTLEQVPPPLPLHLPSPSPSFPLPFEVGPLIAARGSGGAL